MKKLETNKVYIGSCLEVLKKFPDESIDTCITSPPYWGLRDYGVDNQLGLEETPEEFISKLCDVFDEVNRVLRPHGSCWVNLGDSYCRTPNSQDKSGKTGITTHKYDYDFKHNKNYSSAYKQKSLVQIPSRFGIEMTNRGWILRNEIIWHKPSCLPASVQDRYTVNYEKMFFFTKNPKYYFKQQIEETKDLLQRNKRTVWSVNTASFKGAHFATYPPELLKSPIDATCPRFIDKVTKKPREIVIEKKSMERHELPKDSPNYRPARYDGKYSQGQRYAMYNEIGYDDGRDDDEFEPGIVLDPFFGSGTTAEVAMSQDKDWVGIELNKDYVKISDSRLEKPKIVRKTREKSKQFWE